MYGHNALKRNIQGRANISFENKLEFFQTHITTLLKQQLNGPSKMKVHKFV